MTLLDVVQQIVNNSMESAQLTDMAVGTITSMDPLEVTLDVHQAALTQEVLIVTDAVKGGGGDESFFQDVDGVVNIVWGQSSSSTPDSAGLAAGDKVLLLSVRHGQKYLILSRL